MARPTAKAEILRRIHAAMPSPPSGSAVRGDCSGDADREWLTIARGYEQQGSLNLPGCIALFSERLRDYGAGVFRCESSRIPDTLVEVLRRREPRKILFSPDIREEWLPADSGLEFVRGDALPYEAICAYDGVLTGCMVAIAATGTLGLCHAAGYDEHAQKNQGRRALTLLPDYHLCIVQTSAIVETVPEALRVLERFQARPITLISGPSATADIEMTRIQGVHGPRSLDVLIVG
jgi:L-lactate dehydrogenase complex protein LldG